MPLQNNITEGPKTTILGILFLVFGAVYAFLPIVLEYTAVMKSKVFVYSTNVYVLGGCIAIGLFLVLSPDKLIDILSKVVNKLTGNKDEC